MQGKMYVKNFKKNTMYLPMLLKTEHLPTSMKPSVSHPDCFSQTQPLSPSTFLFFSI